MTSPENEQEVDMLTELLGASPATLWDETSLSFFESSSSEPQDSCMAASPAVLPSPQTISLPELEGLYPNTLQTNDSEIMLSTAEAAAFLGSESQEHNAPNTTQQMGLADVNPIDIPYMGLPDEQGFTNNSSAANNDSFLSVCLQLSATQIQTLMTRLQAVESSLHAAEAKIVGLTSIVKDFTDWSKRMEKHYEDTSSTVLNLLKTLQKQDNLSSLLTTP